MRRRRHRVGEGPSIPTPPCSSRNSKALRISGCERTLGGVNVGAVQPRRHASTMLQLFVSVMVKELQLLAEASPLRSTPDTGRHHHCARLCDACAQQNALAEQPWVHGRSTGATAKMASHEARLPQAKVTGRF